MFPKAFLGGAMAACMALCWHVCIFQAVIGRTIYSKPSICLSGPTSCGQIYTVRRTNILAWQTHLLAGRTKRRFRSHNLFALFSKSFCPVLLSFLPVLFVSLSCAFFAGFKSFCPYLPFPVSLSSLPSVCFFLCFCRFLFFFLSLPWRCKHCICRFFETV